MVLDRLEAFFHYKLPSEKIAQWPMAASGERSAARLLHCSNREAAISDCVFADLPSLLQPGDLLVLNNSKVLPWRLFGKLEKTGREVEFLLLERRGSDAEWVALAKPMRKLSPGDRLLVGESLQITVGERSNEGRTVSLSLGANSGLTVEQAIQREGVMPIPPYIREGRAEEADQGYYQCVFAENPGSVAAPTAGFHFTPALFDEVERRGVEVAYVTLHVGPASFLPLEGELGSDFQVGVERYQVPTATWEAVRKTKHQGGRVVAVGTTSVRTLESYAALTESEQNVEEFHQTDLVIQPGYQFQVIDSMITNFHQPRTTHLLLVAAFIGEEKIENIYRHALAGDYRFLSYGDAMLLERELR